MDPLTLLLAASVFTLIGVCAGIATGLIPGLHVNNVALAAIAIQGPLISLAMLLFGWADPTVEEILLIVSTLIIGNVVTHTFLDFIPSVNMEGMKSNELCVTTLPTVSVETMRCTSSIIGLAQSKRSIFGEINEPWRAMNARPMKVKCRR